MLEPLDLCNEGLHYTGVKLVEDKCYLGQGGVEFIQFYPHPMLGHTTEKVGIRSEDLDKVIDYLVKCKECLNSKTEQSK